MKGIQPVKTHTSSSQRFFINSPGLTWSDLQKNRPVEQKPKLVIVVVKVIVKVVVVVCTTTSTTSPTVTGSGPYPLLQAV